MTSYRPSFPGAHSRRPKTELINPRYAPGTRLGWTSDRYAGLCLRELQRTRTADGDAHHASHPRDTGH